MQQVVRCRHRRVVTFLAGVIGLTAFGCGGSAGPKLVPVAGKVTLGKTPLGLGTVSFHPDAAKGNTAKGVPTGMIQSDGAYKVVTGDKEGAPVGWYKVTVDPRGMPADMTKGTPTPAKVPAKYLRPETSGFDIEVVESAAPGAYDLRLGE